MTSKSWPARTQAFGTFSENVARLSEPLTGLVVPLKTGGAGGGGGARRRRRWRRRATTGSGCGSSGTTLTVLVPLPYHVAKPLPSAATAICGSRKSSRAAMFRTGPYVVPASVERR